MAASSAIADTTVPTPTAIAATLLLLVALATSRAVRAPLRVLKDPYRLEGFVPFPKPLWGTITSDKLIPVPLFQIAMQCRDTKPMLLQAAVQNIDIAFTVAENDGIGYGL